MQMSGEIYCPHCQEALDGANSPAQTGLMSPYCGELFSLGGGAAESYPAATGPATGVDTSETGYPHYVGAMPRPVGVTAVGVIGIIISGLIMLGMTCLGTVILVSILAHKATAAFSLTSLFVLGKFSKKKSTLLLILFSLMTPLGALVITPFFAYGSETVVEVLTGLTAGTFLWVATGDMLPEVFHTRNKRWIKLALLIAGIIVMFLLSLAGGAHDH